MKLTKILGSVGVVSAAALALAACGQSGNSNNQGAKMLRSFQIQLLRSYQAGWYRFCSFGN